MVASGDVQANDALENDISPYSEINAPEAACCDVMDDCVIVEAKHENQEGRTFRISLDSSTPPHVDVQIKNCFVNLGVRAKIPDPSVPIDQPVPKKSAPVRRHFPYDRNVRLGPRPRQHDGKTLRKSSRKPTPHSRFNYGVVKCSICGRSFFCEAMATEHYDGIIACSFECVTKSQQPN